MSEFFHNIKVKTGKGSSFLDSSKIQAEYSRSVKNFILVIIDDPYQLLIHERERELTRIHLGVGMNVFFLRQKRRFLKFDVSLSWQFLGWNGITGYITWVWPPPRMPVVNEGLGRDSLLKM